MPVGIGSRSSSRPAAADGPGWTLPARFAVTAARLHAAGQPEVHVLRGGGRSRFAALPSVAQSRRMTVIHAIYVVL